MFRIVSCGVAVVGITTGMVYYKVCSEPKKSDEPKKHVLILGGGWAGSGFCNKLDKNKYSITVVNRNDKFLDTPNVVKSLDSTYPHTLSLYDVINRVFDKSFVLSIDRKFGECTDINTETNKVVVDGKEINYDYLVVALGSQVNDFNIKGVKDNCLFLKTDEDVKKIKELYNDESKKDLPIFILGAGATGIELAMKLKVKFSDVRIVEAMGKILPIFSDSSQQKILEELKKKGVILYLDTKVQEVEVNKLICDSKTQGTIIFPYDSAIFTCGVKPNSLISQLMKNGTYNPRGLITDNHLRVSGCSKTSEISNVYAIGDVVLGKGPPIAQNAVQQGKYLAKHFNGNLKSDDKSYEYNETAKILHCGDKLLIEMNGKSILLPHYMEFMVDCVKKIRDILDLS
jgi:NADH:ubiquinone reductase (non-electrogenic)